MLLQQWSDFISEKEKNADNGEQQTAFNRSKGY